MAAETAAPRCLLRSLSLSRLSRLLDEDDLTSSRPTQRDEGGDAMVAPRRREEDDDEAGANEGVEQARAAGGERERERTSGANHGAVVHREQSTTEHHGTRRGEWSGVQSTAREVQESERVSVSERAMRARRESGSRSRSGARRSRKKNDKNDRGCCAFARSLLSLSLCLSRVCLLPALRRLSRSLCGIASRVECSSSPRHHVRLSTRCRHLPEWRPACSATLPASSAAELYRCAQTVVSVGVVFVVVVATTAAPDVVASRCVSLALWSTPSELSVR